MSLIDLYIKDRQTGDIHRIGDDRHDMIHIDKGQLHYRNLQNGDGCVLTDHGCVGGYEFVDNTDDEGFNADPREEAEDD